MFNNYQKYISILLAILVIPSAFSQSDDTEYSFFTAGHVYGNPNVPSYGIHQSFLDYFPQINSDPKLQLGFFTGDVVKMPTAQYFDSLQIDLDQLVMPYYIAAGNHDISNEFTERFGDYYYSFMYDSDLFIVLTPGLDQWNIQGEQLIFLENTLESYANEARYIFIMLHQLIWWSPDNVFRDVDINWEPHYPGSTNFDEVVKPLLLSYSNQIVLYAGDVGSKPNVSPCMYYENQNITYIASGMGSNTQDNIVITNITENGLFFDLIALNGADINAMGELTDWTINLNTNGLKNYQWEIYPNPVSGFLKLHSPISNSNTCEVIILNLFGERLLNATVKGTTNSIDISDFASGPYYLQIFKDKNLIEFHMFFKY